MIDFQNAAFLKLKKVSDTVFASLLSPLFVAQCAPTYNAEFYILTL